jgi:hypothetical protein
LSQGGPALHKTKTQILKLIVNLLSLVALVDIVLLGVYIVNSCLALAFLSRFEMEATLVGIATIVSVSLIMLGSYLIHKNHFVKGGISNITAGAITAGIYLYYVWSFPILLQQFSYTGYFLLLPAPISGLISIMTLREKKANSEE